MAAPFSADDGADPLAGLRPRRPGDVAGDRAGLRLPAWGCAASTSWATTSGRRSPIRRRTTSGSPSPTPTWCSSTPGSRPARAGLEHRGLRYFGSPVELLARVGVAPEHVGWSVLTHLHYDHTGVVGELPSATYIVQQAELDYWTGPWAGRIQRERWLFSPADLDHLTAAGDVGRLRTVAGDEELLPGLSVHLVGGHTAGMQVVRLRTPGRARRPGVGCQPLLREPRRGPAGADPALHDRGLRRLRPHRRLGRRRGVDRPGPRPGVLERFPTVSGALSGRAVWIA